MVHCWSLAVLGFACAFENIDLLSSRGCRRLIRGDAAARLAVEGCRRMLQPYTRWDEDAENLESSSSGISCLQGA